MLASHKGHYGVLERVSLINLLLRSNVAVFVEVGIKYFDCALNLIVKACLCFEVSWNHHLLWRLCDGKA